MFSNKINNKHILLPCTMVEVGVPALLYPPCIRLWRYCDFAMFPVGNNRRRQDMKDLQYNVLLINVKINLYRLFNIKI